MLFIPPWVSFVLVDGWKRATLLSVILGVVVYIIAFITAIIFDQPFRSALCSITYYLRVIEA
jgi:ABC-type Mn2+/Zn2+ transport system permease subunit